MHLFDKKNGFYGSSPIVANAIPLGVGMGYFNKINKQNKIVTIFLEMVRLKKVCFMSH